MGGGDLNSKKSWHPNTIKNQERVWKAEQAAVQEKKRIVELQKERAGERDLAELNALAKQTKGNAQEDNARLNWMYDKPDKKVQSEDFLLGKSVDTHADGPTPTEKDSISAVSRRVAGASLLGVSGDVQVDLARKMREDPLLLVKERERAARAALLNNPLQRKKLTELLRHDQEQRKEKKLKKPQSKEKSIDNLLAAKLNALGGESGLDLAALLASDDSSSDSSDSSLNKEKAKKKKKKKKSKDDKTKKNKKKSKKIKPDSDSSHSSSKKKPKKSSKSNEKVSNKDISSDRRTPEYDYKSKQSFGQKYDHGENSKKRHRSPSDNYNHRYNKRKSDHSREISSHRDANKDIQCDKRDTVLERKKNSHTRRSRSQERRKDKYTSGKGSSTLSESERAVRLAAMAKAGAENELQRGKRVAAQRIVDNNEQVRPSSRRALSPSRNLPTSLESRIHSNRHYIQRDKSHMNEHFARR